MQNRTATRCVNIAGTEKPAPEIERKLHPRGVMLHWTPTIDSAARLVASAPRASLVLTHLALKDGNWRDLVERVRLIDGRTPVILMSSVNTAELWWDALECGVADIVPTALSERSLCEYLDKHLR